MSEYQQVVVPRPATGEDAEPLKAPTGLTQDSGRTDDSHIGATWTDAQPEIIGSFEIRYRRIR